MSSVDVRYNIAFGVVMGVCGLFVLVTGLMLSKGLLMFLGALNTLMAVMFATKPMFTLERDHVALKNLWGMTLKRHEFASLGELSIENRTIYRTTPEGRTKVVSKGMGRAEDWQRVVEAIKSGGGNVS